MTIYIKNYVTKGRKLVIFSKKKLNLQKNEKKFKKVLTLHFLFDILLMHERKETL